MAAETRPAGGGRIARNTAIFSVLTGLSRIAGLAREIVAAAYFGTSGAASAFTLAFQVPNLVRSLFADSALSAAFVPVFTDLLEKGNRRDAFRLASTLAVVIVGALGSISALFIIAAPWIMPLLTDTPGLDGLATGLSQVLFPIVLLLGLNGLVVGILNAYDHFTIPALAPLVWNLVIIAILVATRPLFDGDEELYAYAIGIVVGTLVQLLMVLPVLRKLDFHFTRDIDLRDPRLRQVLTLMLPVTVGLGLINFGQVIASTIGFGVSESAPRAIDNAFRIYMLPQGMFSVAVATVLFPALSRLVSRRDFDGLRSLLATGTRGVFLLLIPCAALTLVLAEPITRLVYERGAFGDSSTEEVSTALLWFSLSSAVLRRQPPADADVLQPPAPVARHEAVGADAPAERGGVGRAGRAVRDRGHRDRHGGLDVRHDGAPGVAAAARAARAPGGVADAARRRRDARGRRGSVRRRVRGVVVARRPARALPARADRLGRPRAHDRHRGVLGRRARAAGARGAAHWADRA